MTSGENPRARTAPGPLLGFLALILLFGALASFVLAAIALFWILLLLGLGVFIAFVSLNARNVRMFLVSRQARYGANVAISLIGLIGIVVIVNVVVSRNFDKTADLTADKLYTLSDQTKKILNGLQKEVKALAFFIQNSDNPTWEMQFAVAKDLLTKYARESDKLTVEFIDPHAEPQISSLYGTRFGSTVVFESGEKREYVTIIDEQKYTSAVMKVVRDEIKRVYFLTGHGERGIDVFDAGGYQQAKEALEIQNYGVHTLTLTTEPDVPADCSALVIAAPKISMLPHEVDAISRYLKRNGKLLLMFEPSFVSAADPNQQLIDLMNRWGVTVADDNVLVFNPYFFDSAVGFDAPVVRVLEFHEVTQYVDPVIFQTSRSVTPRNGDTANLSVKSLAKTIDSVGVCWGETERREDGTLIPKREATYTEGVDTPPPLSLAVAVELKDDNEGKKEHVSSVAREDSKPAETQTRIVVFGDSDFASNNYFARSGGGALFLNTVNWLTLEEDLIAIRPVDPSQRALRRMTAGEVGVMKMVSVFLIPIAVFIIGVTVWWRRR